MGTALWQKMSSLTLQIWYIIPADKVAAFLQYIRETIPNGVGLSYIKQLLPQIPRAQMAALGAVRIVQEPGQAVITCPVGPLACTCVSAGCKRPHALQSIKSLEGLQMVQGLVFHFTLSCGTSEAEATNFYLEAPDTSYVDIWRGWCRYAQECIEVRLFSSIRVQYCWSQQAQHQGTTDGVRLPRISVCCRGHTQRCINALTWWQTTETTSPGRSDSGWRWGYDTFREHVTI